MTAAAKEIVKQRYGTAPSRSYFERCSEGGREGVMTALRFPTVFDGVIAAAPGIKYPTAMAHWQRNAHLLAAPGGAINSAKLQTLGNAVLAACDTVAADGLVDGIVSSPETCSLNPSAEALGVRLAHV